MKCKHLKIDEHQLTYGSEPTFEYRHYCKYITAYSFAIGEVNGVPECLTCLRYEKEDSQ